MMNSVTIVGRITKDVELRYSQSGKGVANFTVAVNRNFKNANGERETDFINVVQFGKGAEVTAQYMKKGSLVGISGRIQTRNYENSEGRRVYVTEIVANEVAFLESKNKANTSDFNKTGTNTQGNQRNAQEPSSFGNRNDMQPIDVSDDELPF